jgi:predicted site-specific integrase-resolvase
MQTQNLAVGYARVSREGEDVGNQVHVIDDYAKTNNLTLVGVFNDVEGFKLKLGDSMLKNGWGNKWVNL